MDRYRVVLVNMDGMHISTEDDEDMMPDWIWRTLKHLREEWPVNPFFSVHVEQCEKIPDKRNA